MQNSKKIKKLALAIGDDHHRRLIDSLDISSYYNNSTQKKNSYNSYSKKIIRLCLEMLKKTGCRIDELRLLKKSDLNALVSEQKLIIVTAKTKNERCLHISKEAAKTIKQAMWWLGDSSCQSELAFPKKNGEAYGAVGFRKMINGYIGLVLNTEREKYTSHSYRRGLITKLAKSSNPRLIADFVGHKNVTTTLRYVVSSEQDMEALAQLV